MTEKEQLDGELAEKRQERNEAIAGREKVYRKRGDCDYCGRTGTALVYTANRGNGNPGYICEGGCQGFR